MILYKIKRKVIHLLKKKFNLVEKSAISIDSERRKKLQLYCEINKIIDVGANSGQYALEQFKTLNYKGTIVSFEPMKSPFQTLLKKSNTYNNWIAINAGLGVIKESKIINVAKNSFSSSLLEMLPSHLDNAPQSVYVDKEEIQIDTLSNIYKTHCSENDHVFLKIDTQGYEYNVLEGGLDVIDKVKMIQIEMSLIPLYDGEKTFDDMMNYLTQKHFKLVSIEPGFYSETTGQLLQMDGIFVNTKLVKL